MKSIGIIGLGTVFEYQLQALEKMQDIYRVTDVYDQNEQTMHKLSSDTTCLKNAHAIVRHKSLDSFLKSNCDSVLISVPLQLHYDIALQCLNAGKNVLLEKPAVTEYFLLEHLYQVANYNHRILQIAYHASFGCDIEWYLKQKKDNPAWEMAEKISEIRMGFFDPYIKNGILDSQKIHLGGSYIDSGVNELSVLDRLVDLSECHVISHKTERIQNCVSASETILKCGEINVILETGWNRELNQKNCFLKCADGQGEIVLDHSNQRVIVVRNGQEKIMYSNQSLPRLVQQYIAVFRAFEKALDCQIDNRESSRRIHRLLFS